MSSLPKNKKIAVIGGDERQIHCGAYLADKGFETALYGFDKYQGNIGISTKCRSLKDALCGSSIVILPLPVTRDMKNLSMPLSDFSLSLDEVLNTSEDISVVFGGNVPNELKEKAVSRGIRIYDYFDREELQIANAYLTAESAVGIAMNELKHSLRDSSVLVMGYGRIGKSLCHILKAMGVDVYASARKYRDFEWIRAYGYSPVDTSNVCSVVSECKLIFNTIPGLVLGRDELCCINDDCLIIDLASKPGGVDFEAADSLGLRVIWALALPGKKLPESAGRITAETILNILEDEEENI